MSDYLPLPDGVSMGGCWLMLDGQVNMDDLIGSNRPGRIIRMLHPEALKYIPAQLDNYDRIAGMVSDAA